MHAHALTIFNTAISNPNQTSGSAINTAAVVLLPMVIIGTTMIIKFVWWSLDIIAILTPNVMHDNSLSYSIINFCFCIPPKLYENHE